MKEHKGMGFDAASKNVQAKQGISKQRADAIIAAGARNASRKAKKSNPNLKKVKMKKSSGRGY